MRIVDYIFTFEFLFVLFVLLYLRFRAKWCQNYTCLVGKTVIVTGANKGIGFYCALDLAKRGARVILACRNQELANEARNNIIESTQNKNIVVKYVDFMKLKTVRDFAKDISETEERLDVLVNNIGVGVETNSTEDGLPLMLQVNYYAHVLLTVLLLDKLKRNGSGRVINVSSILAMHGNLNPKDLNQPVTLFSNKWLKGINEYANAKFGLMVFTQRLAELLKEEKIHVFSVHPGAVQTELLVEVFSGVIKFMWYMIIQLYTKTAEEGAQTLIYLATEPGIEEYSGRHFQNCGVVFTYPNTRNRTKRNEIFEQTLKTLGLEEEFKKTVMDIH